MYWCLGMPSSKGSRPAPSYAILAIGSPTSVVLIIATVVVGIARLSVFETVCVLTAIVAGTVSLSSFRCVRRSLYEDLTQRERSLREGRRLSKLASVVGRRAQYEELRLLVEAAERRDPKQAERLEIEGLLDRFALLAAREARCLESVQLAGDLETGSTRSHQHREVATRRARYRDACLTAANHLAGELEAIEGLVRLVAQRFACPQLEHGSDTDEDAIERRLRKLDEGDAVRAPTICLTAVVGVAGVGARRGLLPCGLPARAPVGCADSSSCGFVVRPAQDRSRRRACMTHI